MKNYCIKNIIAIFVATYIHDGGQTRLYATGIFYALSLQIFGSVPPCVRVMQSLPSWCRSTGKAEPFFISASNKQFLSVMTYTEKTCSNGHITSNQNRVTCESGISVFNFEGDFGIRVDVNNGNPLFCLSDVCHVLGIANPSDVKRRLNPKGIVSNYTLTKGGKQTLLFISEGNLYRVVFRSDKPNARKFEDWVTDEVLPSIRKTGMYATQQAAEALTGQYIHVTGADGNLYLYFLLKAMCEFLVEETKGNVFTEKRLVKKFEAAWTLCPEEKKKLRNINVKISSGTAGNLFK